MVGSIKHIHVIQSLVDERTGKVLYDDSIAARINYMQPDDRKMTHKFCDISNKQELINELTYLENCAKYIPGGILIHFEIHGSTKLDGLVLKDGSLVKWAELADLLRPINVLSCNKLFLTMATCYGRFLYLGVDSNKKSPYSGFISASKEVKQGEVVEKFTLLFEELTSNYNLVEAYKKLELATSNFYYKDSDTCFEEAIEETRKRVFDDPSFRDETKELLKKAGKDPDIFTKEDYDLVAKAAFANTYLHHKSSFIFTCE